MKKDIEEFIKNNVDYDNNNKLEYYNYIIPKLISKNKPIFVIETGSMHVDSQGSFTQVLAYIIKNYTGGKLITIDISEEHLNKCKQFTKEYSDVIEYINSDSITYLKSLSDEEVKSIDLFYFDSFDLNLPNPIPSQEHHLKELLSVYDRLNDNVILSVDDNYFPHIVVEWIWLDGRESEWINSGDNILGKGTLINDYLLEHNWNRIKDVDVYPKNNTFIFEKEQKKLKECFLITSYCDTEEKIKVLKDTLKSLEKYNLKVCVHAHYPLPDDIQKNIQYYIYDSSNPIVPFNLRSIIIWRKMNNYQMNILKRDYGYTVVSQWKQSLLFLNQLNYDKVHILNYDTIISDELLENSNNNYSSTFYLRNTEEINLLFATIKPLEYLDVLKSITMKDYILMNEYWYAEKYFYDKFKGNNLYLNKKLLHKNIRHQPYELDVYKFDDYNIHFGERINWVNDEKIYTDNYTFMFYDIKKEIDFKIFKGYNRYIHKTINDFKVIDTNITTDDIKKSFGYWSGDEFVKGDDSIKILINDKILDDNITSNFCISAIEYNV